MSCRVLKVSTSGYYERRSGPPSARDLADQQPTETITSVHDTSHSAYGAPRVHAELRLGLRIRVGRKRVTRLMRTAATHPDLVKRQFRADGPDRVWFTDITQHRAAEGWVYCCAVIDAYSRRVAGWSITDHIHSELVVDALDMARWQRRPTLGTVVHSDRGSTYTSWVFGHRLRQAGLLGSMGRVASSVDNALIESFVVHDATRTTRPPQINHLHRAGLGHFRMDRGLVQPETPPQQPRNALTTPARNPCPDHPNRGMTTTRHLSGKPGQAPKRVGELAIGVNSVDGIGLPASSGPLMCGSRY